MQQSIGRGPGRPSKVVRADAIEFAIDPPAILEPSEIQPRADSPETKEAQAWSALLVALSRQVEELRGRRRQTIDEVAGLSVELGVTLAERLLGANIAANRQRLDRIVRQALDRLPPGPAVSVRGHPDDITLLKQQLAEEEDLQSGNEPLNFRHDSALARGHLRLEAGDYFVAWDTASCLAELRTALLAETLTDE